MNNISSALLPVGKIFAMRPLKVLLLLGLATLVLGLVSTKPASAQEGVSVQGWTKTTLVGSTCSFNVSKTYLSTGATVLMEEGGYGVEQFRAKFSLYKLNRTASATDAPEGRRTYESEYFGDTEAYNSFKPSHTFRQLAATDGYVLRVKYIFVGYPARNYTFDARVCNNTKGGYVQNKYYPPPK